VSTSGAGKALALPLQVGAQVAAALTTTCMLYTMCWSRSPWRCCWSCSPWGCCWSCSAWPSGCWFFCLPPGCWPSGFSFAFPSAPPCVTVQILVHAFVVFFCYCTLHSSCQVDLPLIGLHKIPSGRIAFPRLRFWFRFPGTFRAMPSRLGG